MQVNPASLEAPVAVANPQAARLMSLDVFRGATIAAMMLVNNPGSWDAAYKPLLHAEWNGWTFTDLIFPFFLWIVGVAIPLSTARRIDQGQGRTQLLVHAVRRAAIIFALGLFLNSFNYLIDGSLFRDGFSAWFHNWATNIRIPGVLQRIAVCYWLIDVQGWRKWARPFAIYGMNAITVFVLAGISGRLLLEIKLANAAGKTVALKTLLYDHLCAPFASRQSAPLLDFLASPKNASLMWALMYVLALYVVAYVMYRRKWFVRF
jgi:predicted acyltransferase